MLLDMNFKFKDLSGTDIGDTTLSKMLAEVLAGQKTDGISPVKAYDWAVKFHNDGKIDIDATDSELLEKVVASCEALTNIGKAQMINAIKEARS